MTEPNAPLLRRTLARIRGNPYSWNQAIYRMVSPARPEWMVGCYATWACELAGGIWSGLVCLAAEPADDPRHVFRVGDVDVIDIDHRARRVLGLSHDQADDLFHPSNNLHYIEQAVRELCDGTAPTADFSAARRRREKLGADMRAAVDHIEPKGQIQS